jgi:23S rRNA pseudouridine955/2504/2580 synthase
MKYWLQTKFTGPAQNLVEYLSRGYSIGKGVIYNFIKNKKILVNGAKINLSYRIKNNDQLIIKFPLTEGSNQLYMENYGKNLHKYENLNDVWDSIILEETENFFVVNKPRGWATQDGSGNPYNIDDWLTFLKVDHYLVHRLDKDTTGLMLVAKNRKWAKILSELMAQGEIKKYYQLMTPYVRQNRWIGRSYIHENVNYFNSMEPNSETIFDKVKDYGDFSEWEAQLVTGKKHQIRIHCKLNDIPIVGDGKYNGPPYHCLCLHSYKIEFFYGEHYRWSVDRDWNS